MMPTEGLIAALVGGVLTSASPCALAALPVAVGFVGGKGQRPRDAWGLSLAFVAGMNITLVIMGLAAARLGLLMGTLPGPWLATVGIVVAGLGVWIGWGRGAYCTTGLPASWQARLHQSGPWGAALLGALLGTVMSPCATPALAAALTFAGSGALLGQSTLWGAAMLLAYGLGHSVLLLLAGVMPSFSTGLIRKASKFQRWIPGRRFFGSLTFMAGLYWMALGLGLNVQ